MKKILTLLTVIALAAGFCNEAKAQFVIKGGLSYSNLNMKNGIGSDFKDLVNGEVQNFTGWHAGIGYKTESLFGFSFQPEVLLEQKGEKLGKDLTWKLTYVEVPVNVQWGLNLVVCRPFIYASPYVGYCIANKLAYNSGTTISDKIQNLTKDASRWAYGFGLGAGIDIYKFQISAKYSWNFGEIVSLHEYKDNVSNIFDKAASCLEISIALLL